MKAGQGPHQGAGRFLAMQKRAAHEESWNCGEWPMVGMGSRQACSEQNADSWGKGQGPWSGARGLFRSPVMSNCIGVVPVVEPGGHRKHGAGGTSSLTCGWPPKRRQLCVQGGHWSGQSIFWSRRRSMLFIDEKLARGQGILPGDNSKVKSVLHAVAASAARVGHSPVARRSH